MEECWRRLSIVSSYGRLMTGLKKAAALRNKHLPEPEKLLRRGKAATCQPSPWPSTGVNIDLANAPAWHMTGNGPEKRHLCTMKMEKYSGTQASALIAAHFQARR
ncbi:hypothetical protein T10_10678 [Trichinella papuae]|uniref:Uncharacterized protein n=1 Tax=Trichinella papuae TaxID=268474 RepID=A0A0V1MKR7_9BILA|nr:hypothetical protein T10_10678 [Trichinella papuae]